MLAETTRRVDDIVAGAQASGRVPSLVAAVLRDGEVVHFTGGGELPRTDAGIQYRIGSITKTFVAAVVMALRDEGLVALEDPLDKHLPGTPVGGASVRQLLGHVGG